MSVVNYIVPTFMAIHNESMKHIRCLTCRWHTCEMHATQPFVLKHLTLACHTFRILIEPPCAPSDSMAYTQTPIPGTTVGSPPMIPMTPGVPEDVTSGIFYPKNCAQCLSHCTTCKPGYLYYHCSVDVLNEVWAFKEENILIRKNGDTTISFWICTVPHTKKQPVTTITKD